MNRLECVQMLDTVQISVAEAKAAIEQLYSAEGWVDRQRSLGRAFGAMLVAESWCDRIRKELAKDGDQTPVVKC